MESNANSSSNPSSNSNKAKIRIEVSYALPQEQEIVSINAELGITALQAIQSSGLLEKYADIELIKKNKIGIFGKLTKPAQVLREGDRVEIYRPLIADPKEVRRRRAAEGKRMKKGGGNLSDEENMKK